MLQHNKNENSIFSLQYFDKKNIFLTLRQCIKKSVMKRVPVRGSNLTFLNIIFRIKCNKDMMRSSVEIAIKGAKNERSFFLSPIITRIDDKTPKHEKLKYITPNHNVTNKKEQ